MKLENISERTKDNVLDAISILILFVMLVVGMSL